MIDGNGFKKVGSTAAKMPYVRPRLIAVHTPAGLSCKVGSAAGGGHCRVIAPMAYRYKNMEEYAWQAVDWD